MRTIDFFYWIKQYEKDYPQDVRDKYPIFIDRQGKKNKERSPYFKEMSEVLQKRGYLKKLEFITIGIWKTERQRSRYEDNTDVKVEYITNEAFRASDKEKVKLLCKLKGVGVPVASAILTVFEPEKYCILDYRAFRALLWLTNICKNIEVNYAKYSDYLDLYDRYATINNYLRYLNVINKIGLKNSLTPRQVEMAFWKFDQYRGEKR